jgi:hypothetical protein
LSRKSSGRDHYLLGSVDFYARLIQLYFQGCDFGLRLRRNIESQFVLVLKAPTQVVKERRERNRISNILPVGLPACRLCYLVEQAFSGVVLVRSPVKPAYVVPVNRVDDQPRTNRIADSGQNLGIFGVVAEVVGVDAVGDHHHLATIFPVIRWPVLRQVRETEVGAGGDRCRTGG